MIKAVQLILDNAWLGRVCIYAEVVMLPATGFRRGYTCSARVDVGPAYFERQFFTLPSENLAQSIYNDLQALSLARNGKDTGWLAYLHLMPSWAVSGQPPEVVKDFTVLLKGALRLR